MRSLIYFLMVIILFFSCAKTSSVVVNSVPPKAPGCEIEVMLNFPYDMDYKELCLISAQSGQSIFSDYSQEARIAQLKEEACKCGANALVLKSGQNGSYNWGQGGFNRAEAQAIGLLISEDKTQLKDSTKVK